MSEPLLVNQWTFDLERYKAGVCQSCESWRLSSSALCRECLNPLLDELARGLAPESEVRV